MNANKVIPENLVDVCELCEIHLYKLIEGPIRVKRLNCLDCALDNLQRRIFQN